MLLILNRYYCFILEDDRFFMINALKPRREFKKNIYAITIYLFLVLLHLMSLL